MKTFAVLLAGILSLGFSIPNLAFDESTNKYSRDVDFLLVELEKRADHFFELKKIDWASVSKRFREQVKSVTNNVEHVKLCWRLIVQLRDGHARLRDLKVKMPDESGGRRRTGPRVHLVVIGEKVYVRQAFRTANEHGIEIGMEVSQINDTPARRWLDQRMAEQREERGYSTDHQALYAVCHWGLADWAGTKIKFDLLQDGKSKTVNLIRQGGPNYVPLGPVFWPENVQRIGRQSYGKTKSGFGYIHLRNVPGNLPEQLDTMLDSIGEVPGFILDMRANGGGGCDHSAVFGRFVPSGQTWRQYRSAGKNPYAGSMVVIVDAGTRSAGETVAGMFKEDGRAFMIGDTPSAGTSSQKATVTVPSGLFSVYFSVRSNKKRFNSGRGIEGLGVPPNEFVPYEPSELAEGSDTQIRRAEELLKEGFPRDAVPYSPR